MKTMRIAPFLMASVLAVAQAPQPGLADTHTTVSKNGIVSSFTRNSDNAFRIISTLLHPAGYYQTAVFNKLKGGRVLGYKLEASQKGAISTHVSVVAELAKQDPPNWSTWTTSGEEEANIPKNSEPPPSKWDTEYLNAVLAKFGLSTAIEKAPK